MEMAELVVEAPAPGAEARHGAQPVHVGAGEAVVSVPGVGAHPTGHHTDLVEVVAARLGAVDPPPAVQTADARMTVDDGVEQPHQRGVVLIAVEQRAFTGEGEDGPVGDQLDPGDIGPLVELLPERGLARTAEFEDGHARSAGTEGDLGALPLSREAQVDRAAMGVGDRVAARPQRDGARLPGAASAW